MRRPSIIALRAPDGPALAGLSWRADVGAPGILVIPGLGSRKENHADFAAVAAAHGMGVVVLDVRGHGTGEGDLDGGVMDDVAAGLDALAALGHAPLGVRGSSMGALLALNAPTRDARVRAVVAICPARPDGLAQRIAARWPLDMPLEPAVDRADGVARGYWHATGDDQVPWGSTLALAGLTPHPMRLHVALGAVTGAFNTTRR